MTAERDSFSVENRVSDPGPGRFGGATLTNPAKDSLLEHYQNTCALIRPEKIREQSLTRIADALGGLIEQKRAEAWRQYIANVDDR